MVAAVQVCPTVQAATDPHPHALLAATQVGAVGFPPHVAALPHMHVPESCISPETVHPAVESPTVPQIHRLFTASQVGAVVLPPHVAAVPHVPPWQVSPATAHVTESQGSYEK